MIEVEPVFPVAWASVEFGEAIERLKRREDKWAPLGSDHGTGHPRRRGQQGENRMGRAPKPAQDEGEETEGEGGTGPRGPKGRAEDGFGLLLLFLFLKFLMSFLFIFSLWILIKFKPIQTCASTKIII